jgi:L-ribulose-5-phosphate 3-epimerase UlaE
VVSFEIIELIVTHSAEPQLLSCYFNSLLTNNDKSSFKNVLYGFKVINLFVKKFIKLNDFKAMTEFLILPLLKSQTISNIINNNSNVKHRKCAYDFLLELWKTTGNEYFKEINVTQGLSENSIRLFQILLKG